MFIGDGAKLVRDAFALAKEKQVMFFSELRMMCRAASGRVAVPIL